MLTSSRLRGGSDVDAQDVRVRPRRVEQAVTLIQTFGIIVVAIALVAIFGLTSPDFLSGGNITNILIQTSVVGVVAIGETVVMLLGGIDLSVGSVVLLSAVLMGGLTTNDGVPVGIAIAVGLVAAMGAGLVNGLFIAVVGIEPIIVTLGTLLAIQGLGQVLLQVNKSWIMVGDPLFLAIATQHVFVLPLMGVIMLVLYIVAAVVLKRTPFGRYVYALGGNPRAARLTGIPVTRVLIAAYVLAGLCAGIGGLLEVAQLGIVSQNVGSGMEFNAITAVLVGGLGLTGGVGRVEKTLLGALVVEMVTNYLTIQGISAYYEQAVAGFIILAAVFVDHVTRGRREQL